MDHLVYESRVSFFSPAANPADPLDSMVLASLFGRDLLRLRSTCNLTSLWKITHYQWLLYVTGGHLWQKKCHILASVTPLQSHVASCDIGHWTCDDLYCNILEGLFYRRLSHLGIDAHLLTRTGAARASHHLKQVRIRAAASHLAKPYQINITSSNPIGTKL